MRTLGLLSAVSAGLLSLAALAQPNPGRQLPAASSNMPTPVTTAPVPPVNPPIIIKHGRVYTVGAMGTLADGDVLIENGKITQVGPSLITPPNARVINANGKPVTPGLMASWTQLGIQEIQLSVSESNDTFPNQSLDSAAYDVADAMNPNSSLIPVARIAGVTRSLTAPTECGNVFCGTSAVIHLGNGPDIIVRRNAGVLASLIPTGGADQANTRPDLWVKFRETLDDAREYWAQRAGYHRPGGSRDQRSFRVDLDALGPVIHGEEPLIIHVERASDILRVLDYASANKLRVVLLGVDEGWMVAKQIAAAQVPVIVDADHNLPTTFSSLGATLKNAARMDAAGVKVIFMPQDDDPAQYARTITQIAGNAVANGMPWDHALASITRKPAEVWGIADQYGTLEVGKDADVVVWDGDPLNVTSAPTAVFIKGVNIPLVSRQTMLRDRYRNLSKKGLPFGYR